MTEKTENMTHLNGSTLVSKSHPRIILRGKLDFLQAKIIEVQIVALKSNKMGIVSELDETLEFVRQVLAHEVKEKPFGPVSLFGLSDEELRERSHNPKKYYGTGHITPTYQMGEIVAALNILRTHVREVELLLVSVFEDQRMDLVRALNRLSSAIYIIMCREAGVD